MKTISINTYSYDELSSSAKERARQWYRNSDYDDFFADSVIEDAVHIADLMGLDIMLNHTKNGTYTHSIYYSGFSSQGSGACFKGSYRYKKGSVKAVKDYAPKDIELHRIAKGLQDAQRKHFYKLRANTTHKGRYCHEYSMTVDVFGDTFADISEAEKEISELLRDFARWIYKQLESAYDHENSDDIVTENIVANDYYFLESGERA